MKVGEVPGLVFFGGEFLCWRWIVEVERRHGLVAEQRLTCSSGFGFVRRLQLRKLGFVLGADHGGG